METAEREPSEVMLRVATTPREETFGVFIIVENLETTQAVDAYNNAIQRVLGNVGLNPRHNTALVEEHEPGRHYWEIYPDQIVGREESDVADQIRGLFETIRAEAKQKIKPTNTAIL